MGDRLEELLDQQADRYRGRTPRSLAVLRELHRYLPLGVASSFQVHYPYPLVVERASGSYLWDLDGNRYLDLHAGFGTNVCGHAHPVIVRALRRQLQRGAHYATPVPQLLAYARELCRRFDLEAVRLTQSGTEATMQALRLARAWSGRDRVVLIEGSYHGHHDPVMVYGQGDQLEVHAASEGIPAGVLQDIRLAPFNDLAALEAQLRGGEVAAVMLEPVMLNLGMILPRSGYLEGVAQLCQRFGTVLIFDQVKTGLTLGPAGAQAVTEVQPDLHCLGKAIGGGLPVGAVGGRGEIMELIGSGRVPHYGTFSGNPLAVSAGLAALTEVLVPEAYERLAALQAQLQHGLEQLIQQHGLPCHVLGVGAKGGLFFRPQPLTDHRGFEEVDGRLAQAGWLWLAARGVLLAPGADEQWTLNVAMGEREIARITRLFADFARQAQRLGLV